MQNILQNPSSQVFEGFLSTCPHEHTVDRALWFFERGEPIKDESPDAIRLYTLVNSETGITRYYFVTLLRALETSEPVGVHIVRPFKEAQPETFFGGWHVNTFADTPGGGLQFFINPGVDLKIPLLNAPSYVSQDFAEGDCPPLVPYLTTVWTEKRCGAPLSRATLSAWERRREVAA